MSLAKRIVPVMLHRHGQLVKGQSYQGDRVVGHAIQASKIYGMRGVDELILLDISATQEERDPDYFSVKALSDSFFSPLTVGGGVKTAEHVKHLLRSGADKVSIGAAALDDVNLIESLSQRFGRQCITVSVDVLDNRVTSRNGKKSHSLTPKGYARLAETMGAGEILLNNVEKDGTMEGYDLRVIQQVASSVSLPVVACGGCSGYQDMADAISAGADAVAAGALFQFTDATPAGAAEYLDQKNIEVRI